MESDVSYFTRRAAQERAAARRAITPEARQRRLMLALGFEARLEAMRVVA